MKISPRLVLLPLALMCSLVRAADPPEHISVTVGKSYVVETPADMERVAVATEDIVEAVAISTREVVLNGKNPGETSLLIWQHGAPRLSYDVTVVPSTVNAEILQRRLHLDAGDSVQGELEGKSVILRGQVTQEQGDRAMSIASAFGTPVNLMTTATPAAEPQVLLKVRFADVERSASLQLGANFFSTGTGNTQGGVTTQQFTAPSTPSVTRGTSPTFNLSNALNVFLYRPDLNLGATIEALAAQGLVQILAEPNVLASIGKPASFLAGGEFPFPVVQNAAGGVATITIQFREFGIRLNFTPTLTPRGTIKLEVAPEVSSLDYANGLTIQGFNIPGLDVRRVKTEIELQNNQSFAIAGLLDNTVTENLSKIPGLGDIPFFGKLFQSKNISRNNTELMVVVTPEIVRPMSTDSVAAVPLPLPFLKGAPTALTQSNPAADAGELPKQPAVPFVPTGLKTAAPAPSPSTGDQGMNIRNSLKGEITP